MIAHVSFWLQVAESLPNANALCVGNDFNMTEAIEETCGGSHTTIQGSKLVAWEILCMFLRLEDAWHCLASTKGSGSLSFSQSYWRIGGTNLFRIDRWTLMNSLVTRVAL